MPLSVPVSLYKIEGCIFLAHPHKCRWKRGEYLVLRDLVPACAPIMIPLSWKECYLDSDSLEGLIHPLCLLKGNNLVATFHGSGRKVEHQH